MKKIIFCLLATFMTLTFIPHELKATTDSYKPELQSDANPSKILLERLDKKTTDPVLSRQDKKALRKDARAERRDIGGGVYISAGALIIIIILLIILF
jgi:hypothetical protein